MLDSNLLFGKGKHLISGAERTLQSVRWVANMKI
jgi:hypothetical protein